MLYSEKWMVPTNEWMYSQNMFQSLEYSTWLLFLFSEHRQGLYNSSVIFHFSSMVSLNSDKLAMYCKRARKRQRGKPLCLLFKRVVLCYTHYNTGLAPVVVFHISFHRFLLLLGCCCFFGSFSASYATTQLAICFVQRIYLAIKVISANGSKKTDSEA